MIRRPQRSATLRGRLPCRRQPRGAVGPVSGDMAGVLTPVYLGSSAEATPAWNTPKRGAAEPAGGAVPATTAAGRLRRPAYAAGTAPPAVSASAARSNVCALPDPNGFGRQAHTPLHQPERPQFEGGSEDGHAARGTRLRAGRGPESRPSRTASSPPPAVRAAVSSVM